MNSMHWDHVGLLFSLLLRFGLDSYWLYAWKLVVFMGRKKISLISAWEVKCMYPAYHFFSIQIWKLCGPWLKICHSHHALLLPEVIGITKQKPEMIKWLLCWHLKAFPVCVLNWQQLISITQCWRRTEQSTKKKIVNLRKQGGPRTSGAFLEKWTNTLRHTETCYTHWIDIFVCFRCFTLCFSVKPQLPKSWDAT